LTGNTLTSISVETPFDELFSTKCDDQKKHSRYTAADERSRYLGSKCPEDTDNAGTYQCMG
jgi:hypothetical protein